MRLLLAALATTSVLAQWSEKLTQQTLNRRHSLAEHHQKGNEKKHNNRAPNNGKKNAIPSNNEELHSVQRMLKHTRESTGTISGRTTRGGTDASKAKRGGGAEMFVKREEGRGAHAKDANNEPATSGNNDSFTTIDVRSNPGWGKDLMMTAAYAKSQKSDKAPEPAPAKSPSNGNGGKRPGSTPATPTRDDYYGDSYEGDSKSGKSSSGSKSGKSRVVTSGICNKRLMIAFEEIVALGPNGPFGTITTPSDVTELCAFVPPTEGSDDFNFGCPFLFIPGLGFLQGEEEYIEVLGEEAGTAFNSLVLYCQCQQGFDLGCAAKIPHGPPTSTTEYADGEVLVNGYSEFIPFSNPAERADYCKMVGVWNGDFDSDVVQEFSPDVMDCGCFFTGTAKDMVGTCPGVELGAFFEFPSPEMPTYFPTYSPTTVTQEPAPAFTFFDSFESGDFPGENWTVSNGDINLNRRLQDEEEESSDWTRTTNEAFDGDYSIISPDLSNDDFTPRFANVTLAVSEDWDTPGILTFAAIGALIDDFFLLVVDDEVRESDIFGFEWETYEAYLGPGSHVVTWIYAYNPFGVDDPGVGAAFLDKVTFLPTTAIPTSLPTTYFPSYSPTLVPTLSPTVETQFPTYSPTITDP